MHPLTNKQFRWMFAGQVLSLVGVGLLTVALSLTAYRLGGTQEAGKILGLVLALKMIAYVTLAPLGEVVVSGRPPRRVLIALDVMRMLLLVPLAWVDNVAALAGLTFLFFAVSSTFTPLFQATIPAVLDDDKAYAKALALSRVAYTLEAVLSPVLAGLALAVVTQAALFELAAACFFLSALALAMSGLKLGAAASRKGPFLERISRGVRIELLTPRLRGLLAMNLGLSLGLAWVLVNSVVVVGLRYDGASQAYTALMAGYGIGAAAMALAVPFFLQRLSERQLMIAGCGLFALATPIVLIELPLWLAVTYWSIFGIASSMVLTPGGLVLNNSVRPRDRPALFAAQFSLSHAGWLVAYPLAGWLGAGLGVEAALLALGTGVLAVTVVAARLWPADDPLVRPHRHADLPPDHPHLKEHAAATSGNAHAHAFFIDEYHRRWSM